jgi:hypothetical protein
MLKYKKEIKGEKIYEFSRFKIKIFCPIDRTYSSK